jgi:hypothetical protein
VGSNLKIGDIHMKLWSVPENHPVQHMRGRSFICCTHPGAPLRNSGQMKNFRDEAYFVRAQIKSMVEQGLLHIHITALGGL